jgi:hypothetical protein
MAQSRYPSHVRLALKYSPHTVPPSTLLYAEPPPLAAAAFARLARNEARACVLDYRFDSGFCIILSLVPNAPLASRDGSCTGSIGISHIHAFRAHTSRGRTGCLFGTCSGESKGHCRSPATLSSLCSSSGPPADAGNETKRCCHKTEHPRVAAILTTSQGYQAQRMINFPWNGGVLENCRSGGAKAFVRPKLVMASKPTYGVDLDEPHYPGEGNV